MTKIIYKQEHAGIIPYIIPGCIAVIGLFAMIYFLISTGGFTETFIEKGLIPGIFAIVFSCFALLLTRRKVKTIMNEFKEVREKGKPVFGTVSKIITHTEYTHHNGHTTEHHSYTFLVTYTDPITNEEISAESLVTYQKYTLIGTRCKAQIFNGKIIVDEADAEAAKEPKKWPAVIIIFLIFAAIVYFAVR